MGDEMSAERAERTERLSRSLVEAMVAVPEGQGTPLGRALRELVGAGFPWADEKVGDGRLWTMDRPYRRWLAIGLRAGYAFGLGSGDRKAAEAFFGPTGPIHGLRTTAEAAQEALRRLLVSEHVDVDELQRTHDELRAALHATDSWGQTPADEPNVAGPPPYAWKGGLVSSDPQLQVVSVSPPSTPVDFGAVVEPEPPYRLSHDKRFPVLPIFSDEQIERARWLAGVPAWQRSIERWCRLVSHVNSVLFGMEYPSDCVCGLLPDGWSWRRSEHLERMVEQLVLDAIAAIDQHGALAARQTIGWARGGNPIDELSPIQRAAYDAAHAAARASELEGLAERVKERTDLAGDRKGHNLVVAEDGAA